MTCRLFWRFALCLAVLGIPVSGNAEVSGMQVTPELFEFDPAANGFGKTGLVRLVWAPTKHVAGSGPFLFMSGDPDPEYECRIEGAKAARNCDSNAIAGCFADAPGPASSDLTGLAATHVLRPQCPSGGVGGDSFAAWDEDGGIALYTHTGPSLADPTRPAFMQTRGHAVGNHQVHGNYVHFPAGNVSAAQKTRPFAGAVACTAGADYKGCIARHGMRVTMQTGVHLADLPDPGGQQALQKLGVILRNQATGDVAHRIHLTPRVFCSGRGCDGPSTVQVDPNQGGANFVSGVIGAKGTQTIAQVRYGGKLHEGAVWTSTGPGRTATKAPTGTTTIRLDITWGQFVRTLRLATYRGGLDGAKNANVSKFFGDGWSVPGNWVLRDVRVGQEVMNNNWSCSAQATPCSDRNRARMGGHVAALRVAPIRR